MAVAAARVAVCNPEPLVRVSLASALRDEGYVMQPCASIAEVEVLVGRRQVEAAIVVATSRHRPPSDADRADIARLCLTVPTIVMHVELEDPTLTVRRLTRALRNQNAPVERVPTYSRELLKLFFALRRLLAAEPVAPAVAMQRGADALAEVLGADIASIFMADQRRQYLVALGTSATPMGQLQEALGLNRVSIAAGGRVAEVYRTGRSMLHGRVHEDPLELSVIRTELGMRSCVIAPLVIGGERRGALLAGAQTANFFSGRDRQFLEAVGFWIGLIGNRGFGPELLVGPPSLGAGRVPGEGVGELITRRQQEIASLVADGLSNAEIAARLVLSPGTVANHVAQILQRLEFRSRTQIATWAAAHGLHPPPTPG
jgi:DNA-binding CsgD family transcriptional regulator